MTSVFSLFCKCLQCFTSVNNCFLLFCKCLQLFYTVLQGFVCPFFYLAKINGFQCDNAPQEESLTIQVFTTVFPLFLKCLQMFFYCFASVYNVLQVFTTVCTLFYKVLSVPFLFGEKNGPVWQCSSRRMVNHTRVYNCLSTDLQVITRVLQVFTTVFYCFISDYKWIFTV